MSDLSQHELENQKLVNRNLTWLTLVLYSALYFAVFLIGDFYLLFLTGAVSLIWSVVIGTLSLNRIISNHFATIFRYMLAGWGGLIFAFIVLLIYAWIVGGYQANLNELTRSFGSHLYQLALSGCVL